MNLSTSILIALLMTALSARADNEKLRLRPEQIVQFAEPQFACVSKEKFEEAVLHGYKNEDKKFQEMFVQHECIEIAANVDFKVLTVVERHPEFDIIEIVLARNTALDKLFTEWDYAK